MTERKALPRAAPRGRDRLYMIVDQKVKLNRTYLFSVLELFFKSFGSINGVPFILYVEYP